MEYGIGVDAICIGEGEYPCLDFVNYYARHGRLDLMAGSFWVKDLDGTVYRNPVRPFITDLDNLPFPDIDVFDYCNLRSNVQQNTAEVIVSRGCTYSCTYCANAQLRNIYPDNAHYSRFRSPENAILLDGLRNIIYNFNIIKNKYDNDSLLGVQFIIILHIKRMCINYLKG